MNCLKNNLKNKKDQDAQLLYIGIKNWKVKQKLFLILKIKIRDLIFFKREMLCDSQKKDLEQAEKINKRLNSELSVME